MSKVKLANEIDLAELVKTPKPGDCPYTLFLGAGASASSGIHTANAMIDEWQYSIFKSINKGKGDRRDFERWLKDEYPDWKAEIELYSGQSDYSFLFSYRYKQPQERQLYIEKILEDKKPTFGYLYLASLIEDKYFNRILTTNFDDLLNDTLRKFYDNKPMVCAFDSAITGIRVASQKPKIVKLHGDFLYSDIRNLDSRMQYSFRSVQENMDEKIQEMCKGYGLIVAGYRGADESIMTSLRNILRNPEYLTYGLHWCIHKPSKRRKPIEIPPLLQQLINTHKEIIHVYEIESFDYLMEAMHVACQTKMPKVLVEPDRYNLSIDFFRSVQEGSSKELSKTMTEHLDCFLHKMNSKDKETDEFLIKEAEMKWQRGRLSREEFNDEEALELFLQGYELIRKVIEDEKPDSVTILVEALRRQSGLCIGIAKLRKKGVISASSNGDNVLLTWKEALKIAINSIDKGLTLVQTQEAQTLPLTLRRSFQYNGCCAYSLLSAWENKFQKDGDRTDEEKLIEEKVFSFVEDIKKLDKEKDHLPKLLEDGDFKYIQSKLSLPV